MEWQSLSDEMHFTMHIPVGVGAKFIKIAGKKTWKKKKRKTKPQIINKQKPDEVVYR